MEKARYIKSVVFSTVNDLSTIEKKVNSEIDKLRERGVKIIAIVPHNWGISPVNLIYDIIYEGEQALD